MLLVFDPEIAQLRLQAATDSTFSLLMILERSQGGQVLRVFNPCTDDFRESGEEISARSGELVAADESTVIAKPLIDTIVVEDC